MKTKTVPRYECEVCMEEYPEPGMALKCEQYHGEWKSYLEDQTEWGKQFLIDAGKDTYEIALDLLAESENHVQIQETDDIGPVEYAIVPEAETSFWLEICATREDAEKLCQKMGWKYAII